MEALKAQRNSREVPHNINAEELIYFWQANKTQRGQTHIKRIKICTLLIVLTDSPRAVNWTVQPGPDDCKTTFLAYRAITTPATGERPSCFCVYTYADEMPVSTKPTYPRQPSASAESSLSPGCAVSAVPLMMPGLCSSLNRLIKRPVTAERSLSYG